MASNHTASSASFNDPISMLDASDTRSATQLRTICEKLHDNTAYLREQVDPLVLRQTLTMRKKAATLSDTGSTCAASALFGVEGAQGPAVLIKGQESLLVYDNDDTVSFGAVTNIGTTRDAAVNPAGRIVVIGSSTPWNAYRTPGGSWTGGGSQMGGAPNSVIYDPGYGGFMAGRSSDVWRSTDATSWASVPTGLAGVLRLAAVGAGDGAGRVVALSTATTPTFAISTNHGASFSASGGTVPDSANADGSGTLAGCPIVSRLNLNRYVYHVARFSSGARIRIARSADGVTWTASGTIDAETGWAFTGTPTLLVCQSTGLMIINVAAQQTAESRTERVLYASVDGQRWVGLAYHAGSAAALAYGVARGRTLFSNSADLLASDGIGYKVFT